MYRPAAVIILAAFTFIEFISIAVADDDPVLKDLIAKLNDKDETVRLKAAKDLGKMKDKAKSAIPALTVTAGTDKDKDVRVVAQNALDAIKDAAGLADKDRIDGLLDPLVKDLKSKSTEKRIAALGKLADLGDRARAAGPEVVEFGLMSSSPTVREAAETTLERIDPSAHKLVVTVFFDKNASNQLTAIKGLESLGKNGKSGLPVLKALYFQELAARYGRYTGEILRAMARIAPDDKVVIDAVINVVTRPVDDRTRMPDRSLGVELLAEMKIDSGKKMAALIEAIEDPRCRAQAVTALGKMGPDAKKALPTLRGLKFDGDKSVREAAAAAIDHING